MADGCTTCRPTSATRANAARVVADVIEHARHAVGARQQRRPRAARARRSARRHRREFRGARPDQPSGTVLPDAGGGQRDDRRSRSAARRGIVFITSVSAEMASVNRGDYCVSKAGLSMAAKLFAVRLAPHRHSGLRSPSRHHRHRHDRRREGQIRPAHRRRADSRCALGHARGCRARGGGVAARRRAATRPAPCCTSTAA